ncbi:MAG: hypothetical protein A3C10_03100 [Candidatus Magasanikbacteria bacterium RIFCSPHIGHO2_02_FULL_48_18]|nr:MAG: hypothetical protein A3C10_03100 [Candidatus Magasanikbacteria bacterium RIFCSPHIGHO2_02_FULL_48_18]
MGAVGRDDVLENAFLDHGLGPGLRGFLGRLEHEPDVSGWPDQAAGNRAVGAEEPGRVEVVSAGVHDALDTTRVGQAGGLLDREGVHVGPKHGERRIVRVDNHVSPESGLPPDDPGLREVVHDRLGHLVHGPHLAPGELRLAVEVECESAGGGKDVADGGGDVLRSHGVSPLFFRSLHIAMSVLTQRPMKREKSSHGTPCLFLKNTPKMDQNGLFLDLVLYHNIERLSINTIVLIVWPALPVGVRRLTSNRQITFFPVK